jgi:hypothetical protein
MIKVHCTLDQLMAAVAACELEGIWSENTKDNFYSFHAQTGEVLNWWPSTGTVQFQGKCSEKFRALFCCHIKLAGRAAELKFATTLPGQVRSQRPKGRSFPSNIR